MPTLILDGNARGAVNATAAVVAGAQNMDRALSKAQQTALRGQRDAATWSAKNQAALSAERKKWDEIVAAGQKHHYGLKRINTEMATSSSAMSSMASFLARWAGPGVLFTGAISGLRSYMAEIDTLIDKVRNQSGGMAGLAQWAITQKNPEAAYQGAAAEALNAINVGAVPSGDLNQAGGLINSLLNASLNKTDRDYLVGLQGKQVIEDATKLAPSIAAFQASFPELSAKQIIGKGLATAKVGSSRLDELIKETGVAAPGAAQLGFGPDWVLGAGAILDRSLASAGEGLTHLASFQRQFEKFGLQKFPEMKGMGPIEVLKHIQSRGTDWGSMEQFLGNRAEAITAGRLLIKNLPELEQQMGDAAGSEGRGLADRFANLPGTVPFLGAGEAGRRSEGQVLTSTLKQTTLPGIVQALQESDIAERRKKGGSEFANMMSKFASFLAPILPEEFLKAELGAQLRDGIDDPVLRAQAQQALTRPETEMDRMAEAMSRSMKSIDKKTRSIPAASGRQE